MDRALVEAGLARSRSHAHELISSGGVLVNGSPVTRASLLVRPSDRLEARSDPYVSRGAYKLGDALDDLGLAVGRRAVDAGSSTGGFTQILLERGCRQVYAVDVGTDQLAPLLRADPRVVVRERTNVRELTLDALDGVPVDVVVGDLSFIPLHLVLERLVAVAAPRADLVLLVKPQFEVGRALLGKNGVVRDPVLRRSAVTAVADLAAELGCRAQRCVRSRHPGPTGNVEFFLWLRKGVDAAADPFAGVDFG